LLPGKKSGVDLFTNDTLKTRVEKMKSTGNLEEFRRLCLDRVLEEGSFSPFLDVASELDIGDAKVAEICRDAIDIYCAHYGGLGHESFAMKQWFDSEKHESIIVFLNMLLEENSLGFDLSKRTHVPVPSRESEVLYVTKQSIMKHRYAAIRDAIEKLEPLKSKLPKDILKTLYKLGNE